jgi:HlyD family secretion protein
VRVKTGVTDGLFTEVEGKGVTEGMKVIDGLVAASSTPAAAAANPMGGQQQQGGRGRPGGGF